VDFMLDAALRSLRINRCLNLWADGVDIHVICGILSREFMVPATEYTVWGIVNRARQKKDPRAAAHVRRHGSGIEFDVDECIDAEIVRLQQIAEANMKDQAKVENEILDLWADGIEGDEIAKRVGVYRTKVADVLAAARRREDPRAVPRKHACKPAEAEKLNSLGVEIETVEVAVTDAMLPWERKPVSVRKINIDPNIALRNIKTSIERERSRPVSCTAALMGDPAPERSALGREIRPDEWASKAGEGRSLHFNEPRIAGGPSGNSRKRSYSNREFSRSW
jgi:transposase